MAYSWEKFIKRPGGAVPTQPVYTAQVQQKPQTAQNPWAQVSTAPQSRTFYGNASDIALAKQSGMQGNFIDVSGWGEKSIINGIQHNAKTGGNPMILGGAGAKGGINDYLLGLINKGGTNIGRIGGKDRYEVQDNLKKYMLEQATSPLDFSKLRVEQATIDDIAKKYGIDYSRGYAKRQAEAEAEAQRNAIEAQKRQNAASKDNTMQGIDNSLRSANEAMDKKYFVEGLNMQQDQANNGLNAGIAADQALRLGMMQQSELAPMYRDAAQARNAEETRFTNEQLALLDAMGLVNKEALAREESLYNDRLQQGLENAMAYTDAERGYNNQYMQTMLQQRGQDLGRLSDWENLQENKRQFNTRQDWEKYAWSNMSAADRAQNQLAIQQLNAEKKRFASEDAWRKYTFNNMSASDRARLQADEKQLGKEMAWRKYEMEYMAKQNLELAKAQYGGGGYGGMPSGGAGPFPTR